MICFFAIDILHSTPVAQASSLCLGSIGKMPALPAGPDWRCPCAISVSLRQ